MRYCVTVEKERLPAMQKRKNALVIGLKGLTHNKVIMSEKSISVSKEQVIWLREMYETYRALLEGLPMMEMRQS